MKTRDTAAAIAVDHRRQTAIMALPPAPSKGDDQPRKKKAPPAPSKTKQQQQSTKAANAPMLSNTSGASAQLTKKGAAPAQTNPATAATPTKKSAFATHRAACVCFVCYV